MGLVPVLLADGCWPVPAMPSDCCSDAPGCAILSDSGTAGSYVRLTPVFLVQPAAVGLLLQ